MNSLSYFEAPIIIGAIIVVVTLSFGLLKFRRGKRITLESYREREQELFEFNVLKQLSQVQGTLEASCKTLGELKQNNSQSRSGADKLSRPECRGRDNAHYDWGIEGDSQDSEDSVDPAKFLLKPVSLESHFIQVVERLQGLEEALKRMELATETFDRVSLSRVEEDFDSLQEINQYLPFFLGDELFAVNINTVTEVLEADKLIGPNGPGRNRMAINLRGSLVPIIDLSLYFGGASSEVSWNTRLLILEVNRSEHLQVVGVKVDGVGKILNIGPSSIEPPVARKNSLRSGFVIGTLSTDYHCVTLLDISQGLLLNNFRRSEVAVKSRDSHLKANIMSIHDSIL